MKKNCQNIMTLGRGSEENIFIEKYKKGMWKWVMNRLETGGIKKLPCCYCYRMVVQCILVNFI